MNTKKHDKNLINIMTQLKDNNNDNIRNLTEFLYGVGGYPVVSTLIKAIKRGHYATWPGFTVERIKKYIKNNIICTKGHIHLNQQVKKKQKK